MRLDSDRKVLSVSSKPRHKMGEENIMKNTSKNTKSVRSDRKHNGIKNYDGEASDSSEELQYGPGIVNRLKTKYLSMTVREHQNRGARPPLSNLRRANSLENLLAAEKTESNNKSIIMSCAKKFESAKENVAIKSNRPSRSEAKPVISRESMKRARSVESLLRTFKDIVIEETTNSCSSQEAVKTSPVKAPNATEYPPPDVVKETLKIFEKCPGQTVVIKAKSPPSKPVISTKPNILSEKSKFNCSNTKPMVSPKPIILTQNYVKNNNEKMKSNINFSYQAQPLVPKARNCMNMPIISSTAHDNSKPKNNVIITSHDCTENKVMQPTESLIMTSENKTDQSKVNKTESPIVENNNAANSNFKLTEIAGKVNLSTLNNKESDIHEVTAKSVSNVALNNIRKSGTSVEFKFPCAKNSSYLPQDRNQVRQIGIIKPIQQPAPQPPTNPVNEPVNKMDTNVVSKSPVNQVFLSIKTENVNLWDSKPWHHTQNTMVFNFCNRKDVPDYIENDGLCLHNRNDARGKQIFLSDSKHEIYLTELIGPVESSTDDIDELASNIVFEGANVIEGKSNIQRIKKPCKMNIKFDLNTSVYEYPSEESFEELSCPASPVKTIGPSIISNTINSPNIDVPSNLSSYQPSKLGINTNQFGMKPLHVNNKPVAPQPPISNKEEPDDTKIEDHLQRYSDHQTNGLLY